MLRLWSPPDMRAFSESIGRNRIVLVLRVLQNSQGRIMEHVGLPYRPSGAFGVRDTVAMLILGVVVAALGAGVIWLWEISPIPTLMILTPLAQGALIGFALAAMVKRLRIRNPLLAGTVGIACGLLSVGLVHYGHHLRMVSMIHREFAENIQHARDRTDAERTEALARFERNPGPTIDAAIKQVSGGWGGFAGTMMIRNQQGVTLRRAHVTGWGLWLLWAGEAGAVALIAMLAGSSQARSPYCESCDQWCDERKEVANFAPSHAEALTTAVRLDDPASLSALRNVPATEAPGTAAIDFHTCPGCELTFATVVTRVPTGKKDEVKQTTHASQIGISPAMSEAIRNARIVPPPPPEAAGDEPDSAPDVAQPERSDPA
jgi:hypothetical protein